MLRQLLVGGLVSVINIAIHSLIMATVVGVAQRASEKKLLHPSLFLAAVMIPIVSILMAAHTIEVMVWASAYALVDAAPENVQIVYFAFVNYATLGYGDIVPVDRWKLLGPITAMNGALMFGWSTAVMFEVLRKTMARSAHSAMIGSAVIDLYHVPLPVIFLVGLALIWGVSELGWRLGKRGDGHSTNIGTLESATAGLLALIIGFTFAMALSRFEARRDAVVQEANAIGTTALRARLLPEPHRAESLRLLREYVKVRIDALQSGHSFADLNATVERSNAVQEALWKQVRAVAEIDKAIVPTGLFIQSVNQMIDAQGVRLAALRNRIPSVVLVMLYVLAAAASGFVGYASAIDPRLTRLPVVIMGLLISLVLYLIIDLDRPNNGFITNNQQAMTDVAEQIATFKD